MSKFTIKEIFLDHWDSFLSIYSNVRPIVDKEVRKVIGCGDPNNGYAFYVCPDCGAYKFIPFRCHSRFCNTCGHSYQANRADAIARKLINCTHRHIVFTIAQELRPYFLKIVLFYMSFSFFCQSHFWLVIQPKSQRVFFCWHGCISSHFWSWP